MKKHFVIFFSPGTMFSEQTQKPIDSWDASKAAEMSRAITERHAAARPYGFCFTTRERKDDELDSKEVARSHYYYLGGEILTLEDVKNRKDPSDKILISNMECNNYDRIVVNKNSWRFTAPLGKDDIVLQYEL